MSAAADMQGASDFARQIVTDAGLTVDHGETPTDYQARIAALHGREDVAVCVHLLNTLLIRQAETRGTSGRTARVLWWGGLLLALFSFGLSIPIFWSIAYIVGGSFWTPPKTP